MAEQTNYPKLHSTGDGTSEPPKYFFLYSEEHQPFEITKFQRKEFLKKNQIEGVYRPDLKNKLLVDIPLINEAESIKDEPADNDESTDRTDEISDSERMYTLQIQKLNTDLSNEKSESIKLQAEIAELKKEITNLKNIGTRDVGSGDVGGTHVPTSDVSIQKNHNHLKLTYLFLLKKKLIPQGTLKMRLYAFLEEEFDSGEKFSGSFYKLRKELESRDGSMAREKYLKVVVNEMLEEGLIKFKINETEKGMALEGLHLV
ncbi:MAG: hypothetical protein CME70_03015 [Halobacteriovorax sp.]|nr:hypothetical protein [Halobacteriovorax sp.]|tara:strand:+ start:33094 stop:33870 length:777 start_codon:yes stop_codon:yes gene_type:complete